MKKILLKVHLSKLLQLSTDELYAIQEAQGSAQRFIEEVAWQAIREELARRRDTALAQLGVVALEVESADWNHGYPMSEDIAAAEKATAAVEQPAAQQTV
jgi:hypothetical protein